MLRGSWGEGLRGRYGRREKELVIGRKGEGVGNREDEREKGNNQSKRPNILSLNTRRRS